jgi:carboxymethylenebutenolidase
VEKELNDALQAETTTITGAGGDQIEAYFARPLDPQPKGGVVVIHHMPGYDAATKEMVRKFAANGYLAVCPNLYYREAPGAAPDDAAAFARGQGGVPDERLVGDVGGAAAFLRSQSNSNGKVGVIGHCSGGRQSLLSACDLPDGTINAAVDCYGAFVLAERPEGFALKVTPLRDKLPKLSAPVLGLFGEDDQYPSPAEVAELEKLLGDLGKTFEFHSYPGAAHAFFAVDRPSYRPEAAVEGWKQIFAFYGKYLGA